VVIAVLLVVVGPVDLFELYDEARTLNIIMKLPATTWSKKLFSYNLYTIECHTPAGSESPGSKPGRYIGYADKNKVIPPS
jgi:hypothetical protein